MSRMGDVDGHEFSLGWVDIYIDGSFHAKVFGVPVLDIPAFNGECFHVNAF